MRRDGSSSTINGGLKTSSAKPPSASRRWPTSMPRSTTPTRLTRRIHTCATLHCCVTSPLTSAAAHGKDAPMAERLTDEDLDRLLRYSMADLCVSKEVGRLVAEVRELRAILALPLPCGYDNPQPAGGGVVRWEDNDYDADELLAVGATIIRAS